MRGRWNWGRMVGLGRVRWGEGEVGLGEGEVELGEDGGTGGGWWDWGG